MKIGPLAQKLAEDYPHLKRKSPTRTAYLVGKWAAKLLNVETGIKPRAKRIRKELEAMDGDDGPA